MWLILESTTVTKLLSGMQMGVAISFFCTVTQFDEWLSQENRPRSALRSRNWRDGTLGMFYSFLCIGPPFFYMLCSEYSSVLYCNDEDN